MNDPQDIALRNVFHDSQDPLVGSSHEAFIDSVMVQIREKTAKQKALVDTLWFCALITFLLIAVMLVPLALPTIGDTTITRVANYALSYGINNEGLMLISLTVISGFGWAVAVKD